MKKIFCILIVSLFFVLVKPAFAQTNTQTNQVQSPKEMIWKSPIDRKVKITLMSGERIEGRLTFKQPFHCMIVRKPDNAPYIVHYSNIKEVKIHKDRVRKLKLVAFDVIKSPFYIAISILPVPYWVVQENIEGICKLVKSK